jgi:hypothetical protein
MTPDEALEAKHRFHDTFGGDIEEPKAPITPAPIKENVMTIAGFSKYLKNGLNAFYHEWRDFAIDVLEEIWRFSKSTLNSVLGRPDPVREVAPFYMQLWFLTHRAFLQVYKNAQTFLSEMLLHFGAGVFISIAVQDFGFAGAQPKAICAYTPWNLSSACDGPIDQINLAGMFIALGCLFAGIAVGTNTFGREKVVFWRDTASGMRTIPYFIAKFVIDIPRIILGALFFAIALALFYPYRQSWASLFAIVGLLYFVAFALGYWISTAFPIQKASVYRILILANRCWFRLNVGTSAIWRFYIILYISYPRNCRCQ